MINLESLSASVGTAGFRAVFVAARLTPQRLRSRSPIPCRTGRSQQVAQACFAGHVCVCCYKSFYRYCSSQPRRRQSVLVDREGKAPSAVPAPQAPRTVPVEPFRAPELPTAAAEDSTARIAATPRNRIILADGVMPVLKPPPVTVGVKVPAAELFQNPVHLSDVLQGLRLTQQCCAMPSSTSTVLCVRYRTVNP